MNSVLREDKVYVRDLTEDLWDGQILVAFLRKLAPDDFMDIDVSSTADKNRRTNLNVLARMLRERHGILFEDGLVDGTKEKKKGEGKREGKEKGKLEGKRRKKKKKACLNGIPIFRCPSLLMSFPHKKYYSNDTCCYIHVSKVLLCSLLFLLSPYTTLHADVPLYCSHHILLF
mgnify:CR=1 FL=1